jgi:hypothetical protein
MRLEKRPKIRGFIAREFGSFISASGLHDSIFPELIVAQKHSSPFQLDNSELDGSGPCCLGASGQITADFGPETVGRDTSHVPVEAMTPNHQSEQIRTGLKESETDGHFPDQGELCQRRMISVERRFFDAPGLGT